MREQFSAPSAGTRVHLLELRRVRLEVRTNLYRMVTARREFREALDRMRVAVAESRNYRLDTRPYLGPPSIPDPEAPTCD